MAALLTQLGYPCTPEQALGRIRRAAGRAGDGVLVAEASNAVLALAAYRIEDTIERDRPLCRLQALVVSEGRRGHGLGRALVAAVEEVARLRGCERLMLTCGNWRPEAHRFYEALGFDETGRRFAKEL